MFKTATSTRALGGFSLGLGALQVVAPGAVARLCGLKATRTSNTFMRLIGLRELAAGAGLLIQKRPGVWLWSRVAGDAMDLALLSGALVGASEHRSRLAAALSAVGGITAADVRTAQAARGDGDEQGDGERSQLTKALTIRRDPPEVYQFWRNFRNFPTFMSHLESVAVLDDRRSHWTVKGPAGRLVEWDAEITEDRPDALIAWRSLPGADVENSGQVRFTPAPGQRGTEIRVDIRYVVPGGSLGSLVARLFGQEPRQQVQADLRKLKQVLETGEVTRTAATLGGTDLFQRPAQPRASQSALGARS